MSPIQSTMAVPESIFCSERSSPRLMCLPLARLCSFQNIYAALGEQSIDAAYFTLDYRIRSERELDANAFPGPASLGNGARLLALKVGLRVIKCLHWAYSPVATRRDVRVNSTHAR